MICSQLLMISDCFHIMLKKRSKTRKELFYTLSIQDHNMKTIKNSITRGIQTARCPVQNNNSITRGIQTARCPEQND